MKNYFVIKKLEKLNLCEYIYVFPFLSEKRSPDFMFQNINFENFKKI